MKRNETRVNRIKAGFDRKIREASRQSIVNSVLTDDKLRLMMRVCNLAPKWLSSLENKRALQPMQVNFPTNPVYLLKRLYLLQKA